MTETISNQFAKASATLQGLAGRFRDIPGANRVLALQVQVLKAQEDMLKTQLNLIASVIEALDAPSSGDAKAEGETLGRTGKVPVA